VELSHGGRVTLRLASSTTERVEYVGELVTASSVWVTRATITLADGAVTLATDGAAAAPAWLAAFARATLRTAWRSSRTGASWPRRMNRWRGVPDEKSAG
jgi:hypothetical protein